jgi:flagellar motor switch protein FliM
MIHICIPHLVIEPVIPKLSTKFWFSGITKEITNNDLKTIEKRIHTTLLPIKVVLGNNDITVRDFLGLQMGDVIPLDVNMNDELNIYVGNTLKFNGKPGLKKNKVAVKITKVEKKGDDYDE